MAAALALLDHGLNPAAITREINTIENQLINRAKLRTQRGAPGFREQISRGTRKMFASTTT